MAQTVGNQGMVYNQVQVFTLGIVWLVICVSGIVFFEPAPIDALMMGLVFLLPLVGLCSFTPTVMSLFILLVVHCAACLLSAGISIKLGDSIVYYAITIYLCFSSVVIAGFIYLNPTRHLRVIFSAYTVAAFVAACAGIIGYFDLLPGSYDLFTRYGRAQGTFKDPNVFGPFLIPAILYCFHQWIERSAIRGIVPAALLIVMIFAVLLSFSRGAWMHLTVSLLFFFYFSYVFADSNRKRLKLLVLALAGIVVATAGAGVALQSKKIHDLFAERASLTQNYDVGPNGRFGGQRKAIDVTLDNPLGIGVKVFAPVYHSEQPHNVYLTTFVRTGWIGGFSYLYIVLCTIVIGFRQLFKNTPYRSILLVSYASLLGLCLEGLIVDTDHWRHFYLLLGLVWGCIAANQTVRVGRRPRRPVTAALPGLRSSEGLPQTVA